jgi:hypothetical protein
MPRQNNGLPRNPSDAEGLGYDMIVGQAPATRDRFVYVQAAAGEVRIDTSNWVSATGSGYFFAPRCGMSSVPSCSAGTMSTAT